MSGPVRGPVSFTRPSLLSAVAVVAILAGASTSTQAQQPPAAPAQPQQCTNVFPPFRQNGSQLQQAIAAGVNVSVPVPVSVASAPQITIGPPTLVGSEVVQVKQIIPSTNPSFVFVVVDLGHPHAVGEIVWPTWQGSFCAAACAPGTNAFPQCLPACPALTPCLAPSVPGMPTAVPGVPTLPGAPPTTPAPSPGAAWVAFQGGWAMQVPPFVNPVVLPPVPWQSSSPPPPQATVFQQASATQGAIPSPTPQGPVVYVPSGSQWLMVPSGSWMGASTLIVPILPPLQLPGIPH
jgi:hypothetical protein